MRVNLAHFAIRATDGRTYSAAVFDAKANSGRQQDHMALAYELADAARDALDLQIHVCGVVFMQHGRPMSVGDRLVVDYLSKNPMPRWTHSLDV